MLASLSVRSAELWPAMLSLAALLIAATALFYPPQLKAVVGGWRWGLPLLRGAALLALAGSLLRPVLLRTRTPEEQGTVVVLLDRSLSMSIADRAATGKGAEPRNIGQLVGLAESLGRLPPGERSKGYQEVRGDLERLDAMHGDITRMAQELEFARLSGRETREVQQRLQKAREEFLAVARRVEQNARAIGLKTVAAGDWQRRIIGGRPEDRERLQAAIRDSLNAVRRLQESQDIERYRASSAVREACDAISTRSRLEIAWDALLAAERGLQQRVPDAPVAAFGVADGATPIRLRGGGEQLSHPPIAADAPATDLVGGIAQALRQLRGQPVQAIVLLSDGRQTGQPAAMTPSLLPPGVPVFPVCIAAPQVRDLAVERVEAPTSVFVNELVPMAVTVRSLGVDLSKISGPVELRAGEKPAVAEPLAMSGRKGELQRMELRPVRFEEGGYQKISIELPKVEGEATLENNRAEQWIKVLTHRLKVTAIASSPSWDFRYLCNALSRTGWVQLREALVVPGLSSLALTPQELMEQDLVILSDVPREALNARQWDAISRLVKQRGGSLIVIPGIAPPPASAREYPLAEFLPYGSGTRPAWQGWLGQNPAYHLMPAPGSEELPALQLDRSWDELPAFYQYLGIPRLAENAVVRLMVRETRQPILTESRAGRGRVLFFGMNETWRWRARVGERDQDRLWRQLVRYAIDEPYAIASETLAFDADRVVEPGAPVHVRCRLMIGENQPVLPDHLTLTILYEGELLRTVAMEQAGEAAAGRYRTVLTDLPAGNFELRVSEPGDDSGERELALPLTVGHDRRTDLANIAADRVFLQSLADASGGRLLELEQVELLPQLLEAHRLQQPMVAEVQLWDSAYLFVFVLSCLSVEWAVRKRLGLP